MAKFEHVVTGRFREEQFKRQALLYDQALLSCLDNVEQ